MEAPLESIYKFRSFRVEDDRDDKELIIIGEYLLLVSWKNQLRANYTALSCMSGSKVIDGETLNSPPTPSPVSAQKRPVLIGKK